ncbi:MAG: 50S ribosomal protein L11 methyltransferase [Campylobacterales bacterium]|nr:50S ribosomal protein L11 methyltransferase [Campylobacterales bacterium]
MNNKYSELTISTPPELLDFIADLVGTLTHEAIEIGDDNLIIRSDQNLNNLAEDIDKLLKELDVDILLTYDLKELENCDWISKYQEAITPVESGDFYIHPSWYEPKADKINISIDPALAFGSGHHATTATCLDVISRYLKKDDTIIDVGCGSGILALGAKKLGAATAHLCDTDPIALLSAKENFEKNNEIIEFIWEGSANQAEIKYDIVIANIIADVLVMIAKDLKKITKNNGLLILSGILDTKESKVLDEFNELTLKERILKDEWVTLVYEKEL